MEDNYKLFLKRLIALRKEQGLTQQDMAHRLHISQGQYSKIEKESIIVSGRIIRQLFEMGWDIDYLLTGREGHFREGMSWKWTSDKGMDSNGGILTIMFVLLELTRDANAKRQKSYTELQVVKRCLFNYEEEKSSLYHVRMALNMPQVKMAELLGVNIKKYRSMERDTCQLDAELMITFYQKTKCSPTVFVDRRYFCEMILYKEIQDINCGRRDEIERYLQYTIRLLKR